MRRAVMLAGLGVAAALALVWALGGLEMLGRWAAEVQRALQAPLAGAVRAVKAGEPAAWAGLLSVCFLYGLAHAAGPGHGKFLIGGYGVARRVRLPSPRPPRVRASATAPVPIAARAINVPWTSAPVRPLRERRPRPVGVHNPSRRTFPSGAANRMCERMRARTCPSRRVTRGLNVTRVFNRLRFQAKRQHRVLAVLARAQVRARLMPAQCRVRVG